MGVSDDKAAFEKIVAEYSVSRQAERRIFQWGVILLISGLAAFIGATLSLALLLGAEPYGITTPWVIYLATFIDVMVVMVSTKHLLRNVFWRIELIMDKYSIESRR